MDDVIETTTTPREATLDARLQGPWWGGAALIIATLVLIDAIADLVRDQASFAGTIETGFWDRLGYVASDLRNAFPALVFAGLVVAHPRGRRLTLVAVAVFLVATVLMAVSTQIHLTDFPGS